MSAWVDGTLSALVETVVIGRLAYAVASGLTLDLAPWCFPFALISHLAGQAAAVIATGRATDGSGNRTKLLVSWLGPGLILGFASIQAFDLLGFGGVLVSMITWIVASSRGIVAVTQPTGSDGARRGMLAGAVILALLSLVGWDGGSSITSEILVFLILSSALVVHRRRLEISERVSTQVGTPWAAGGAAFVSLTLVAVLVVYAAGSGGLQTFVRILAACRDFVAIVMGYALTPLAYLVQWLILKFQKLLAERSTEELEMLGRPGREILEQLESNPELAVMPDWLKWAGVLLVVVVAVGIAWWLVSRFYRRISRDAHLEKRASLVEGGAAKEWLDGVADSLKSLAAGAASRLRSLVGREPRTPDEIYAATVAALSKHGILRQLHYTPYEYRDLAAQGLVDDEAKDALFTVTDIFTECHYAERPAGDEELESMKEAYRRILADL